MFERYVPATNEESGELLEKLRNPARKEQVSIDGVKKLLEYFAAEINEEYGPPDIVDSRGAIIGKENDKKVEELQFKFKKGDESFSEYDNRMENKHSIIFEMLVTVIFNKILKSDFIIVHTSKNDDFKHHADNIIIDKKNGNIICTLDEVNVNMESKRYSEKLDRIKKYNKKNGTVIEDGVELNKENKLSKAVNKNIPLFLLQISEGELKEVLEKMNIDSSENVSGNELKVFDKLIGSLKKQAEMLLNEKLPKEVGENINKFSDSLKDIIKIREEKFPDTKSAAN